MKERLDKYISSQSALSRKEAAKAIKDKRVSVNGDICRVPDTKVDTGCDSVTLDGKALVFKEHVYYMMYKPPGVVSATEDREEKTVLDILPPVLMRDGLFPAGRLDKDTTGLLIITDDGEYAHRMLSPKKHVDKSYIATLDREPDEEIGKLFEKGIVLADGTVCKPAKAESMDDGSVKVMISEGKYHQVKRMFAALGYKVVALKRIKIGGLSLDESLVEGAVKELTKAEANEVFGE